MCVRVCVPGQGRNTVDPPDVMQSLKTFYGILEDDGGEDLECGRVVRRGSLEFIINLF